MDVYDEVDRRENESSQLISCCTLQDSHCSFAVHWLFVFFYCSKMLLKCSDVFCVERFLDVGCMLLAQWLTSFYIFYLVAKRWYDC